MPTRKSPRITLHDGTVLEPPVDEPSFSDTLALERHMGSTVGVDTRLFEAGLFYMWRGLRRVGATVPDDFDSFVDLIAEVQESKNGKVVAAAPKASKAAPSK